jgi:hypothetical protein
MKTILFALTVLLFASCSQNKEITLKVCETGEKMVMFNDIYTIGDTVILHQYPDELSGLCFELDDNWIKFDGNVQYLESDGYYKAVVIQ